MPRVVEPAPASRSPSRRSAGAAASPAARQPVLSVSPLHVYCMYLPAQGNGRVDARSDSQLAAIAAARDEGPIARAGLTNVRLE